MVITLWPLLIYLRPYTALGLYGGNIGKRIFNMNYNDGTKFSDTDERIWTGTGNALWFVYGMMFVGIVVLLAGML